MVTRSVSEEPSSSAARLRVGLPSFARLGTRIAVLILALSCVEAQGQMTFTPLGDLPGGTFFSEATAVSADGSVVVGVSNSAQGREEAFRWTRAGGMVALGDLPGGMFQSVARHVSSDGSVVVGYSQSASGETAFRWTSSSGMVSLGDLPGGIFQSLLLASPPMVPSLLDRALPRQGWRRSVGRAEPAWLAWATCQGEYSPALPRTSPLMDR